MTELWISLSQHHLTLFFSDPRRYTVKMSWLLQKIVHNEAMRTDPKEIYGWRVYMLACSVGPFFNIDGQLY